MSWRGRSGRLWTGGPGGGAAGGGANLPAKQVRRGTTLAWSSYLSNEALLAEVDRLWAAQHPDIKTPRLLHPGRDPPEADRRHRGRDAAGRGLCGYRDVPAVQRHLLNLEPYIRRDRFAIQEFVPPAISQYRYGGSAYALPNSFPVRVGVYNASLFAERGLKPPPTTWDAPGWSWDEYPATVRTLPRRGARSGCGGWAGTSRPASPT